MEEGIYYAGNFKREAFKWHTIFTKRQLGIYRLENNRLVRDGASHFEITDRFVDNRCADDTGRYLSRRLLLGKFLDASNIELFRRQQPKSCVCRPMIFLDDRNDNGITSTQLSGTCRPSNGPLTAYQLYHELLRQRLPIPSASAQQDIIAAERRLIYITNLDSHCSLALAATSSQIQAAFLRDFLERHLSFRATIGVHIWSPSPTGYSTFALEFHLPYYAWRQSPFILEDERRKWDGSHLRRAEGVIHLNMDSPDTPEETNINDYIYEAQLSVMIVGIDDWVWTGYCFVDVYFKEGRHCEHVDHYYQEPRGFADPHSCGRFPADPPTWLPREYFLRALVGRMEQVKQEWNNSVSRLVQGINDYVYTFTRQDTNIGKAGDLHMTQQKGFKWTIRVLRQFADLLSRTIKAWETFKDGEIRYFHMSKTNDSAEVSLGAYLAAIDKNVTELKDLRDTLYYQTKLFENMTNSLVTHAQHAEAIITREQSKFIQALTVITIFYLPPTLAAAIFSMQTIMPTDVKFKDWIYTLIALFVSTTLLVLNLPFLTQIVQSCRRRLNFWCSWLWARIRPKFCLPRWRRASVAGSDESQEHEIEEQDTSDENRDV